MFEHFENASGPPTTTGVNLHVPATRKDLLAFVERANSWYETSAVRNDVFVFGTTKELVFEANNVDAKLSKFVVYDEYGYVDTVYDYATFSKWTNKIMAKKFSKLLRNCEPITKLVEVTDGACRYTTTRPATHEEMIAYYSRR